MIRSSRRLAPASKPVLRYAEQMRWDTDGVQAETEIVFAHLADAGRAKTLFEPKNFVFTMKLLGVFDVGRNSDGGPLVEPPGWAQLKGPN